MFAVKNKTQFQKLNIYKLQYKWFVYCNATLVCIVEREIVKVCSAHNMAKRRCFVVLPDNFYHLYNMIAVFQPNHNKSQSQQITITIPLSVSKCNVKMHH